MTTAARDPLYRRPPVSAERLLRTNAFSTLGSLLSRSLSSWKVRFTLIPHQEDGGAIILQRASPGEILAEAWLFSERYHCDATARTRVKVQSIPKRQLLGRLRNEPDFAQA
jgi:hypothetical protein